MNRSFLRTAGELRRRLADLGNPWTVDPRLADDDPLPDYPRDGRPDDEAAADDEVGAGASPTGSSPSRPAKRAWDLGSLGRCPWQPPATLDTAKPHGSALSATPFSPTRTGLGGPC